MESILYGSYDLNSLLHNIYNRGNSGASKVSNAIIKIMATQKDIRTNYNGLDLTDDKNDEVSFIPDTQFQRSKQLHEDPWARQKSQAKIGRLVRQVLKDDGQTFTEKDIEDFVNSFKSFWDKKNGLHKKISIVSGDDILYWYNGRNYLTRSKGELGSSCMSGPNDNHYMEIYAKNPDKIRMVILTEDDKLIGRALLWNIDEDKSGDGIKFYLDRIYTAENSDVNYIRDWVSGELGDQVSYYNSDDEGFKVYLKSVDFDYYPYADTMSYLYKKIDNSGRRIGGGFVSNIQIDDSEYVRFTMISTEGNLKVFTHNYSRRLKAWLVKGECVQDINGDYLPENDCVYSRWSGSYIYKEDAIFSKSMDTWILKSTSIEDPDFGIISKSSLIRVISSYNGEETNPISIYEELREFDGGSDLFTFKKGIYGNTEDLFKWTNSPNPDFIYFDNGLKIYDVASNSIPKIFAFTVFQAKKEKNSIDILKSICPIFEKNDVYYITEIDAKYHKVNIDKVEKKYLSCTQLNSFMYLGWYSRFLNIYKDIIDSKEYSDYLEVIHNFLYGIYQDYKQNYDTNKIFNKVKKSMDEVFVDCVQDAYDKIIKERYKDIKELILHYIKDNYNTIANKKEAVYIINQLILPYCVFYLYKLDGFDSYFLLSEFINKYYPNMANIIGDNGYDTITRYFVAEKLGYSIGNYLDESLQNLIIELGFDDDSDRILSKIRRGIDKDNLGELIKQKMPLFNE